MHCPNLTTHQVSSIKIDPYMNIDAGTMRPKEYVRTHAVSIAMGNKRLTTTLGMVNVLCSMMEERLTSTSGTTSVT